MVGVKDRLGDGEVGPRFHFVGKAAQFFVRINGVRVGLHSDQKSGLGAQGVAASIESAIEVVQQVDEPDGVHIHDCRRGRKGTEGWPVAGDGQNISQAQGISAEQV